jgi:hypothetical protein
LLRNVTQKVLSLRLILAARIRVIDASSPQPRRGTWRGVLATPFHPAVRPRGRRVRHSPEGDGGAGRRRPTPGAQVQATRDRPFSFRECDGRSVALGPAASRLLRVRRYVRLATLIGAWVGASRLALTPSLLAAFGRWVAACWVSALADVPPAIIDSGARRPVKLEPSTASWTASDWSAHTQFGPSSGETRCFQL